MAFKNIIARIKAIVTADNKQFKKGMGETERVAKKTSKNTGASFKKMGGVIKAAASAAIVAISVKMVGALHRLTKQMGLMSFKATAVFGLYRKDIEAMADETAAAMGLTKTEFVNAAAGIQDLLIPIGFARKEATGMTKDLIALSGAMSAWTGGTISAADVGRTFSKALLGEREELKTLGIAISEAEVKARLLEKGQAKLTGQTLAQAKAQITLELITEKSTDAQAAFAEEQDNIVIASAEATANIRSMAESMALILTPATEAATKATRDLTGEMATVFEELAAASESKLINLGDAFVAFFGGFGLSGAQDAAASLNYELSLVPARLKNIDDMIANQKPIFDQLAYVERYGQEYVDIWKKKYKEWKTLYMRDQKEVAAAEKVANEERLKAQQAFYWALEGHEMAHMEAIKEIVDKGYKGQNEAINQANEGLQKMGYNSKALMDQLYATLPAIQATTTALQEQSDQVKIMIEDWNAFWGQSAQAVENAFLNTFNIVQRAGEEYEAQAESIRQSALIAGRDASDALEELGSKHEFVAQQVKTAARQMILAYIAEGIAAQISSALANIPFPFGLIAAAAAGAGASVLLNKLIPSFAEGAIVTGPTLAMVGDNPSGTEAIIPLERWGDFGGGGDVQVTGVLRGTDMYLQNKRFSEKLARTGRA